MTEYELFYLIGESKESSLVRIKEEVKAIVEGEGGSYAGADKSEKRKLAYAIRREVRGTYIAQRFTTPGKDEREESVEKGEENIISRINHKLNLYRDVLRFIVVRAEGLPSLTEEEGSAKVVAEVAKEARVQRATAEKKPMRKERPMTVEAVAAKEEKKEDKKPEVNEDDIDKKLEEVLNI